MGKHLLPQNANNYTAKGGGGGRGGTKIDDRRSWECLFETSIPRDSLLY